MEVDISKFQQVFFEDSLENINNVEKLLIDIDLAKMNQEDIDTIFRCAHSIKGSSGMFAFTNIMQFTHVLESYLELVRSHKLSLTQESVTLLLKSLDCLRDMINGHQQNQTITPPEKDLLEKKINQMIEDSIHEVAPSESISKEAENDTLTHKEMKWDIYFKPDLKIFQHGDDPLRILRALKELGEMECRVDLTHLLQIDKFYPDECYLAWHILLDCSQTEEEIRQHAFEWVEDKSEITFTKITTEPKQEKVSENERMVLMEAPIKNKELTSIRVPIEKVDELINMVGELAITQSILSSLSTNIDQSNLMQFKENLIHLEQKCRKLQEDIMRIRMLPISNIFNRFPRMVHDLSLSSGKKIDLRMSGENTELDKTILEKMIDPLVHLVRNSIDHGIETPEERKRKGKNEYGVLKLTSFHQGSNIIIQVSDDGNGLNYEKIKKKACKLGLMSENYTPTIEEMNELIFSPGFSTAEKVTDISGRGIGMDAVRKNIKEAGGSISVSSIEGEGTTFVIFLPLTLAIIDGQLVQVGDAIYIIPLISMIETIQIKKDQFNTIGKNTLVYNLRGKYIPIILLHEIFNIPVKNTSIENRFLVIVESNQQTYGILIDELLELQQVVIKNLDNCYGHIEGISGAAILGNHTIAFILDIIGIIRIASERNIPKDLDFSAIKTVA